MKMFKLATVVFLWSFSMAHAVKITMPAGFELKRRLSVCGLFVDNYLQETGILDEIAGKVVDSDEAILTIEKSIMYYMQSFQDDGASAAEMKFYDIMMDKEKPRIFTHMFKDFPEVLKDVELRWVLKPKL
jgi:hypothetical protein